MDPEIKQLVLEIARGISRKVRKIQNDNVNLGRKIGIGADGTPTEYIDKVAENIALRYTKNSGISINILSEEAGFIDLGGDYTLILDPIDGTRNAVRGIPFYSTSIAVGRETLNSVEYGVVLNIPTKDIFIAEKNGGAYLNNHQIFVPQHIPNATLSSIVIGEKKGTKINDYILSNNIRSLGAASLEMVLVASGALDCFICLDDHLRITDIAAATLIVREASGEVYDRFGKILDMKSDVTERTSVVTVSSPNLLHRII